LSGFPAAAFGFALVLIDTHIAAISAETFADVALLSRGEHKHNCDKAEQLVHVEDRFNIEIDLILRRLIKGR